MGNDTKTAWAKEREWINYRDGPNSRMALGDLAFEEAGKLAGMRVLPYGKMEATYQGTGKSFGVDYSSVYTGVATPQGGTLIGEFNGICTAKDGDTVGGDLPEVASRRAGEVELSGRLPHQNLRG